MSGTESNLVLVCSKCGKIYDYPHAIDACHGLASRYVCLKDDCDNAELIYIIADAALENETISGNEYVNDVVNHPSHYADIIPGIECIEVTKHFSFCRGNAIKYLWRAGFKDITKTVEDLQKAAWYIQKEIETIENNIVK